MKGGIGCDTVVSTGGIFVVGRIAGGDCESVDTVVGGGGGAVPDTVAVSTQA